jgi:hypothetical protein
MRDDKILLQLIAWHIEPLNVHKLGVYTDDRSLKLSGPPYQLHCMLVQCPLLIHILPDEFRCKNEHHYSLHCSALDM